MVQGGTPCAPPDGDLLTTIADLVALQRIAILAGDVTAQHEVVDALVQLLAELTVISDEPGRPLEGQQQAHSSAALRLRELRDQVRINRALLYNGIAAADHYIGCVAGITEEGSHATACRGGSDPAFFTGEA
jgi:hypothetical protein